MVLLVLLVTALLTGASLAEPYLAPREVIPCRPNAVVVSQSMEDPDFDLPILTPPWITDENGLADAIWTVKDGVLNCTITAVGAQEFFNLQLRQFFQFVTGTPYRITVRARTEPGLTRFARIATDLGGDPWRPEFLCGQQVITLTGEFQDFEVCCIPSVTTEGRVMFEMGSSAQTVFVDSFRLETLEPEAISSSSSTKPPSSSSFITVNLESESSEPESGDTSIVVIASAFAVGLIMCCVIAAIVVFVKMRKRSAKTTRFSNKEPRQAWELEYCELKEDEKIGEGFYGIVMRGTYRGQEVAIKKINNKGKDTDKQLVDLQKEAKLMARLPEHPNLVKFVGMTLPPDPFCLVMHYYKGGSLQHYLKKHAMRLESKLRVIYDIAKGMSVLHAGIFVDGKKEQIIHRDLAARNVLLELSETGGVLRARLTDFGMARAKAGSEEDVAKTYTTIGPIKWMAPEQFETPDDSASKMVYNTKTDVWSFGVTMFEIMQAEVPYKKLDATATVAAVMKGHRLEVTREDCPETIKSIMNFCFNKEPIERPSFKALCRVLKRLRYYEKVPDDLEKDLMAHESDEGSDSDFNAFAQEKYKRPDASKRKSVELKMLRRQERKERRRSRAMTAEADARKVLGTTYEDVHSDVELKTPESPRVPDSPESVKKGAGRQDQSGSEDFDEGYLSHSHGLL